MKRSEINAIIRRFEGLIREYRIALPGFCSWTPEDWRQKGHEYDEIRDNMLGWDVTDYGMGCYRDLGLALITLRNGNQNNPRYDKPYSEKLILTEEGQVSPMHFHYRKMEDIINRGGGNMLMRLYNATPEGWLADTDVTVLSDGRRYTVKGGTELRLCPGESITLYPGLYHGFVGEPGHGPVLIGEVSLCNDDDTDNRFYKELARFSTIEEDEPPYRLLCNEYPPAE